MPIETPNPPVDVSEARRALREISACRVELQTFLSEEFDRWERLAEELLADEVVRHETFEQADRVALDDQIERLASVAAELSRSLSDQSRATSKRT